MSKETPAKRNIVVVGGNFGAHVARSLSRSLDRTLYNLILINARPYRLHLIAAARMVVSDLDNLDTEDTGFARYDKLFYNNNGTFICGTSGEKIDFSVLVLATGSIWGGPLAIPNGPEDVTRFIQGTRQMFKDAQNVVLVGGGPAAIELAGEIKEVWPDKGVTIVHRGSQLLTDIYTDKFRVGILRDLEARGSRTKGSRDQGRPNRTRPLSRFVLTPNLCIQQLPMWGTRPNTAYLASSLGADTLAENGCVKIRPTFQLHNHTEIFAMGDIIDWPEVKQSLKANRHAVIVSKNVVNYLQGKSLKEYKNNFEVLILTGGKRGGLGFFGVWWGIIVGAWVLIMIMTLYSYANFDALFVIDDN
ncbi:hypothetical protein BDZ89DRAFT_1134995 [Hymenopellis radicata]|nr:hypothetical protein BDZ89DRAFT_1134995 [Hymenopellis radicata]